MRSVMSGCERRMTSSAIYIKKLIRKSSRTNSCSRTQQGHNNKNREQVRKGQQCPAQKTQLKNSADGCERQNVVVTKKESEAYGFEIRTYESPNGAEMDVLSCVSSVKDNSPAGSAGLRTGDVIITVNSICVGGFEHQRIIDLILKDSCLLTMVVERGSTVKQRELQNKLLHLKGQLREKCEEFQMLILQEARLGRGSLKDTHSPSCRASELPSLPAGLITSRA